MVLSVRMLRPGFANFLKDPARTPSVAQDLGRMLAKFDRTQIFAARGSAVPFLRLSDRAFAADADDAGHAR